MIFNLFRNREANNPFLMSKLYDETTFYPQFIKDLEKTKEEVIIECPFISCKRMILLDPVFKRLVKRGVKIYVITRDPKEHSESMVNQAEFEISNFKFRNPSINVLW